MATSLVNICYPNEASLGFKLHREHEKLCLKQPNTREGTTNHTHSLKHKRDQTEYNSEKIAPARDWRDRKTFSRLRSPCDHLQTNPTAETAKSRSSSGSQNEILLASFPSHRSPAIKKTPPSSTPSLQRRTTPPQTSPTMPPKLPSEFQGTHIGASVELEPLLLDLAPGHSTQSGEVYQNFSGTPFLRSYTSNSRASNLDDLSLLDQLVGDLSPVLVEAYVQNIHFNFPILSPDYFRLYLGNQKDLLSPVLTAAIYTVSMPWLPESQSNFASSSQARALEQMAFSSLSHSLSNPDLSAIQAGLLLMQRPDIDSKKLNQQIMAAAYELGIQTDCADWDISDSEKALRKRIAWALYMQDKWCALIHGRPSAISASNWIVKSLAEEDFDTAFAEATKSTDTSFVSGYTLFMQMVSLTQILSLVLDAFYSLAAIEQVQTAGSNATRLVLERAKPAQLKLKDWFAALPSVLKMDASSNERPASIGYLHLSYYATEITLHRVIVRSLQTTSDKYLTYICRSAAKTRLISAMDFVNRLRPENLAAFWYFPSPTAFALVGTFGGLLLATAPGQEESEFYKIRLNEYRWTLAVSCKKAPFFKRAVESLDQTGRLLEKLPEKPRTGGMEGVGIEMEIGDRSEGIGREMEWIGEGNENEEGDEDDDDHDE